MEQLLLIEWTLLSILPLVTGHLRSRHALARVLLLL